MTDSSATSITIVILHFGPWPVWTPFFLLSCAANPTVRWLLVGDQLPENTPPNVTCQRTSLAAYVERVSQTLDIRFAPKTPYKMCDIKPAIGVLHQDELKDSDWWGCGDNDVIYGDLSRFLTEPLLRRHWLISNHANHVSGHLALVRNLPAMNGAFRQARRWRQALENPEHESFDEYAFSRRVYGYRRVPAFVTRILRLMDPLKRRGLFVERHSTILAPLPWWNGGMVHPTHWRWEKGHLTNVVDGSREFMYLHFMNFKSNRYLPPGSGRAAWQDRTDIIQVSAEEAAQHGFAITPKGFESLQTLAT